MAGLRLKTTAEVLSGSSLLQPFSRRPNPMDMIQPMGMPSIDRQPEATRPPVMTDESGKKFLIGDQLVDQQDEAGVLAAWQSLDSTAEFAPAPQGNFQPVDMPGFAQYVDKIANPDAMRRMGKNWDSAWAGQGALLGAGLRFVGFEDAGKDMMDAASTRQEQLSPYSMGIEDISGDRSRGIVDWFAGVVGQMGPSVVETAVASLIGGGIGGVASAATKADTALTAVGRFFLTQAKSDTVKSGVLTALKKRAAGEALDAAETKLLTQQASILKAAMDAKKMDSVGMLDAAGEAGTRATDLMARIGRRQSIAGGIGVANLINSQAIGTADVYREQLESGDPNAPDRLAALGLGLGYAAADLVPEYALALRVFGHGLKPTTALKTLTRSRDKALELMKRGTVGGLVGAGLSGASEGVQELLLMTANPTTDWDSPEALSRVANAFAAGAAFGGPIGTLSNLSTGNPANLLNKTTDPITGAASTGTAPAPTTPPVTPYAAPQQMELPLQMPPAVGEQITLPFDPQPYDKGVGIIAPSTAYASAPAPAPLPPDASIQARMDAPVAFTGDPSAPTQPPLAANPQAPAAVSNATVAPLDDLFSFTSRVKKTSTAPASRVKKTSTAPAPAAATAPAVVPDYIPYIDPVPVAAMQKPVAFTGDPSAPTQPPLAANPQAPVAVSNATVAPQPVRAPVVLRVMPKEAAPAAVKLKNQIDATRAKVAKKAAADATNENALKATMAKKAAAPRIVAKKSKNPKITTARKSIAKWVEDLPDDRFAKLVKEAGGQENLQDDANQVVDSKDVAGKIELYTAWIDNKGPPPTDTTPTTQGKANITVVKPAAKAEKPAGAAKLQEKGTKAEAKPAVVAEPVAKAEPTSVAVKIKTGENAGKITVKPVEEELDVAVDIARAKALPADSVERIDLVSSLRETAGMAPKDKELADEFLKDEDAAPTPTPTKVASSADREVADAKTLEATPLERLTAVLEDYINTDNFMKLTNEGAGRLWEAVKKAGGGKSATLRGKPMADFFKTGGSVNLDALRAVRTDAQKGAIREMGGHFRADGKPVGQPMEIGKLTMLVNNFRARLHVAPKFSVFKNQADLKVRNPDLYAKAKAAYPGGDFDGIRSSGFAFGKQVLVFSDEIADANHLRFVLGHEALGHFGFRAIMDTKTRLAMLDKVYNSASSWVKLDIDRYADMHGIDQQEATEEYLANEAANLDNSLVHMIWNAITKALEKIGIKLPGEAARYMIRQARHYVLNGADGQHFSPEIMAQRLVEMEDEAATGSFARTDIGTPTSLAGAIMDGSIDAGAFDPRSGWLERAKKDPKGTVLDTLVNLNYSWGAVVESVMTLDATARMSEGLTNIFNKFQEVDLWSKKLVNDSNQITYTQNGFKTKKADRDKASAMLRFSRRALTLEKGSDRAVDKFVDAIEDFLEFNEDGSPIWPWEATTTDDHHLQLTFTGKLKEIFDASVLTPKKFNEYIKKYGEMTGEDRIAYAALPPGTAITADSIEYRIYYENRVAIAKAAVELLISHHLAGRMEVATAADSFIKSILRSTDEKVLLEASPAERKAVEKIIATYKKLKDAKSDDANKFLVNVTNAFKDESNLKKWREIAGDPKYADWADLTPHIETLNEKNKQATVAFDDMDPVMVDRLRKERVWATDRAMTSYDLSAGSIDRASLRAKQTIGMGYVPFTRRGKYQMNILARAEDGTMFKLAPEMTKSIGYWRDDDRGRLNNLANAMKDAFKGKHTLLDDSGAAHENATLTIGVSEARTTFTHDNTSIYDVLDVIRRAGIDLNPAENTKLVTMITNEDNAARKALHATMKPGEDPDMLRSISEYLEGQARIAAKEVNRNQIQAIMDDSSQWLGSKKKLTDLAKAVETATGADAKRLAQRAYDQYAFMYKHMATADKVMINGKEHQTLGHGERYRNKGEALLEWYSSTNNISTSPEDTLVSASAGRLKSVITAVQLGGSIAVGIINTFSLVTNSYNYLAAYNPENGFGLGHGQIKSATMLTSTLIQVTLPKYGDVNAIRSMVGSKAWSSWGLTEGEARFLLEQTENGSLSAMEATALLQTARGFKFNPHMAKLFEKWMLPFTYTEQVNRRTTALAAYRLEAARLEGVEGMSAADKHRAASDEAHKAVRTTQGEYAMYNRPPVARGNVMSHVFMYKQFSIQMIELMAALPTKQRLIMLGMLFLMAGMKGLPFADDLMDLFDTAMQFFQIKMGPVEAVLGELIGDLGIPGIDSHTALRGIIDRYTDLTVSTRLGLGNQIPFTGIGRAGADPWREATDFLGPMWGGTTGLLNDAYALTNWSIGTITGIETGNNPGRKGLAGLEDILRNSPVAMARALGDTLVYASSGDILTRDGKVVSKDVTVWNLVGRIMGFYPQVATQANDIVRLNKVLGDYAKSVRIAFTQSYVKSVISGDSDGTREVLRRVQEWNRAAKGTGLEVSNFSDSAKTALKSARQTTVQRSLKALPKSVRPYAQEIADINGMPQ